MQLQPLWGENMKALNFSAGRCQFLLLNRSKTCTIRLGDKTDSYAEGDIVYITYEKKNLGKVRLYSAYIDKVVVKPVADLTSEDLLSESPELKNVEDFVSWSAGIYQQEICLTDLVTVFYYSEIIE